MQLILLSAFLVCMYFCVSFAFNGWLVKQEETEDRLQAGVAAFLFGATMLGFVGTNFIFGQPNLTLYTCVIGCLFALLYVIDWWPEKKFLWVPLFGLIGTYLIHRAFPVLHIELWKYIVMATVWSMVMFIVIFFDRLPLLSFLTVASWTLAFIIVGLVKEILPYPLVFILLIIFAPLWAIVNVLSKRMKVSLGLYGSGFLGFILGGVVASCVAFDCYGSGLTLMSYYLVELVLFSLACFGFHPLGLNEGEFAFLKAFQSKQPVFVVRAVFYHEIILALLAALMWGTDKLWIQVTVCSVVLIDLYRKIWSHTMTIKEMWQETKSDIKNVVNRKDKVFSSKSSVVNKGKNEKPVDKKKKKNKRRYQKRKKKK